jgi:hypothetical protein
VSNPNEPTTPAARLTPERENEIRERETAATPAPWNVDDSDEWDVVVFADDKYLVTIGAECVRVGSVDPKDKPNAEFIAHARQDIPLLFAELDAVRADLAAANKALQEARENQQCICGTNACVSQCMVGMQAQIEELENAVAQRDDARRACKRLNSERLEAIRAREGFAMLNEALITDRDEARRERDVAREAIRLISKFPPCCTAASLWNEPYHPNHEFGCAILYALADSGASEEATNGD